ncbi:hypothetical protein ACLOJK_008431 [Asimina triloba]
MAQCVDFRNLNVCSVIFSIPLRSLLNFLPDSGAFCFCFRIRGTVMLRTEFSWGGFGFLCFSQSNLSVASVSNPDFHSLSQILKDLKEAISMPWTSSFVNYSRNSVRFVVFFRCNSIWVIRLTDSFILPVDADTAPALLPFLLTGAESVIMYIVVNLKRYRAVKELGKITMNVRIIAYYQLMQVCQSNQKVYPRKVIPPIAWEMGGYSYHIPSVHVQDPTLVSTMHLDPFHGVEIQASQLCPRNYIIFDQTDDKSRIMLHPAMAGSFNGPAFEMHTTHLRETLRGKDEDKGRESSALKEDSEDIDALMSLEEEEDEDEEVSTGRTMGDYRVSSPDSCSTSSCRSHNSRPSSQKPLSQGASSNDAGSGRKKHRMKKMIEALRGIVPGGEQMDTATVLDEAVSYLKSLKVEVKKLGIGNLRDH